MLGVRFARWAVLAQLQTRLNTAITRRIVVVGFARRALETGQVILGHNWFGWSRRPGSNRRPTVYKTGALPAELRRPIELAVF